MSEMEIGKITITRTLDEDGGDIIDTVFEPETLELVSALGMIEFARADLLCGMIQGDEGGEDE